ncbi:MAG: hypothetical protein Q4C40_05895 [Eubacteriales bacterium]|nr:hypothetical protein [Eubacteriales bacterium]
MAELFYMANQKKISGLYANLPIWYRMSDEECAAYPLEESTVTLQGEEWIIKSKPIRNCKDFCSVEHPTKTPIENSTSAIPYLLDLIEQLPDNFAVYDPESIELYGVGPHKFLCHKEKAGDYALQKAVIETLLDYPEFPDVDAKGVTWPLPTLRLTTANRAQLEALAARIIANWEAYADQGTVTVLVRRQEEKYQMDLIMCGKPNNQQIRSTSSLLFPSTFGVMGKMGFAILDKQQEADCKAIAKKILAGENVADDPELAKYAPWQESILKNYSVGADNIDYIMDMEIRNAFVEKMMQMAVFEFTERAYPIYLDFIQHAAD